jgi:aminoglycoside phosphotransferase (APT) family kinase protein
VENAIKLRLSQEELKSLVRHNFGIELAQAQELTDGWANSAYRIELVDGRRVVLKLASVQGTVVMRYEKGMMETEVQVLRLMKGAIPVPHVYAYDNSFAIVQAEYYFMEYLEGNPYNKIKASLSGEERESIEQELGQYNRIINEVKGTWFGPCASSGSYGSSWPEVFRRMMEDVLADGRDAGVVLPVPELEIMQYVSRNEGALAEVTVPRLVHWDLWDGNVFIHNGAINGIIDFERALWGDPLLEAYFNRMKASEAFCRGYGLMEPTTSQRARRGLYDLYLDLILVIECAYRHYNNPDHEKWASDNLLNGWERITTQ